MRKHLKVILVVGGVLLMSGGATAGAASLISGSQIKKNSIPLDRLSKGTQNKIKGVSGQSVVPGPRGAAGINGENGANGLNGAKGDTGATGAKGATGADGTDGADGVDGADGADGASGVTNLESDGPYPGRSNSAYNLQNLEGDQGAQSTLAWVGNSGATLQESWVMCAAGKTALGGGFGDNDGGGQNELNIVTSAPAQIDDDGKITYAPIDGDHAGSFVPNAWLVEGYNNNTSGDLIVRPHVICANVG